MNENQLEVDIHIHRCTTNLQKKFEIKIQHQSLFATEEVAPDRRLSAKTMQRMQQYTEKPQKAFVRGADSTPFIARAHYLMRQASDLLGWS